MGRSTNDIPVLVVEDGPLLRLDLVDQLEVAGFHVFEAADANAAIAVLVEHEEIRLVLTDVDMPGGMDGVRLAAYIRDRWPPMKVVIVSGYRQVSSAQIPADSRFFSKPLDPRRVIGAMHEMLGSP